MAGESGWLLSLAGCETLTKRGILIRIVSFASNILPGGVIPFLTGITASRLPWPDIGPVTIGTLGRGLFIDDHWLTHDHPSLRVTFVARYVCVAPRQGEVRSCVVVERGRHPALGVVAIRTGSFPLLGKLSRVGIFVTILANLRRAFELYFLLTHRHLVTVPALDRAVRAKQGELGFRMVEVVYVRPGLNVVAGFAS